MECPFSGLSAMPDRIGRMGVDINVIKYADEQFYCLNKNHEGPHLS